MEYMSAQKFRVIKMSRRRKPRHTKYSGKSGKSDFEIGEHNARPKKYKKKKDW